jgi:uncharacterized protein YheU (UPF0270 family)
MNKTLHDFFEIDSIDYGEHEKILNKQQLRAFKEIVNGKIFVLRAMREQVNPF